MSRKIAVKLENVTKRYIVHHEKPTFSEKLMVRKKTDVFTALDDINLTLYKGEKIGILGPNGAGKTTLLKVITGITTPNEGTIFTKGKIVSLIDLEAGFHPDLTGEENIFLNGLIIGMSKSEIKNKLKKIISFADIGNFIDAPLYTYSQGMKLRLGFAIAVYADPEILILDENIAVGDENFRKKSQAKLAEFFHQQKTIIIVSQLVEYLKKNCTRFLVIESGKIVKDSVNLSRSL